MRERIVVLDGAMGTLIQGHELTEEQFRGERFAGHTRDLRGANEVLNLTQPQIIADIHGQYLDAGADIITTNTFNGTAISLSDYGLQDLSEEINRAAGQLARHAADAAMARLSRCAAASDDAVDLGPDELPQAESSVPAANAVTVPT